MIGRVAIATALVTGLAAASPVAVGPGTYRPAFPASPNEREIAVGRFWIDRTPVTNAEFLEFVRAEPRWRRDRVARVLADADYLGHWAGPDALGAARPRGPAVRVSWFAARAYCAWRGGRLPLEKEWELAAAASDTEHDASRDPAFQRRLLVWYAEPTPAVLPEVGRSSNVWGVQDLHGLVWEWIEDYGAALVTADSRGSGREEFCGGAAATSRDPAAYATFLRLAFRSSLQARFTTTALGFRCAYDEAREARR
jgi:formylglycine-generating enzyme